jgi:hypothetical protein
VLRGWSMRLLDLVVQGRCASVRSDDGTVLPSAERFRNTVFQCPQRYVLSDDLVRCATELAYAEGDRLGACLDLIHTPAQQIWAEWSDTPRREALSAIPALGVTMNRVSKRAGALIRSSANCRAGSIRTFWSSHDDVAYLSPMITVFDFDKSPPTPAATGASTWRGDAVIQMPEEPAIDELLGHLRFRFDEGWAVYYQERCNSEAFKEQVLRASLGHCAFDAPMLIAFFLLLSANGLLPRQSINHEQLNRARRKAGKAPLLEHIEVSAPIGAQPAQAHGRYAENSERLSPRLHHVRGHIVRRGASVFWRSPHLRGSARLGQIRTRTVSMTFKQGNDSAWRNAHMNT